MWGWEVLQGEGQTQKQKNGVWGEKAKTSSHPQHRNVLTDNKIDHQNLKQLQMKLIAWNNSSMTKRIMFRVLKEIAEGNERECLLKSTRN